MVRSPFVLSLFTLGCSLLGFSCASASPAPAAPASATAESVQMCTPGAEFNIGADYLVIKAVGQDDHMFQKLEYECLEDQGIGFKSRVDPAKRGNAETCQGFRVPDARYVPTVLFMHPGKKGEDKLPVIYTRVSIEKTISRVFAENPCWDSSQDDDNRSTMLH